MCPLQKRRGRAPFTKRTSQRLLNEYFQLYCILVLIWQWKSPLYDCTNLYPWWWHFVTSEGVPSLFSPENQLWIPWTSIPEENLLNKTECSNNFNCLKHRYIYKCSVCFLDFFGQFNNFTIVLWLATKEVSHILGRFAH